ncbi:MAG: gamma-glutamyltransferase family protein [Caulobacteraceae bacterium]
MRRTVLAALGLLLALSAPSALPASAQARPGPAGPHGMVVAANPLAAKAGLDVLKAGGDAADAAVAIQAVLGLVEPQSSGVGGGAFMTFYDAATHKVTAYNGREAAPAAAGPDYFLKPDGTPMGFFDAVLSGKSSGPPGAIALLGLVQQQHGRKPWASLFGEAERMADDGFVVSPRLAGMIAGPAPQAQAPDIVAYFTKPDGSRMTAGDVLKNPAYARTLRALAAGGPRALYEGPLAADIAARVQRDPGGVLTADDIKAYHAKATPALCRPYRIYVVCVPPSPAGGPAILEMLGLLQRTDIDTRGPNDPKAWFEMIQAMRLTYADRDRWLGDPAFVDEPVAGLLSPAYLDARARLIGETAGPAPQAGTPPGAPGAGADATREAGGTSHFVVVDRWGNVASMTTSVENIFGSGRMVDGFVLNNQLTDFSFMPVDRQGRPAANRVQAGKRPRSAMSPVIVLDRQGRFFAALGSPGGPAILAYNLKTLVGVLDWKLTMQQAIALPNVVAIGDRYGAETDALAPGVVAGLAARGVTLGPAQGEDSGLHGVMRRGSGLEGGADPRREGVVLSF